MSTITYQNSSRSDIDRFHHLLQFLRDVRDVHQLLQPEQMIMRLNALDDLDAMIGGLDPCLLTTSSDCELIARARGLASRFEAANQALYEAAHSEIAIRGNSPMLDRWLMASMSDGELERPLPGLGFDLLDEIVCGVLQLRRPREAVFLPSPEMTAYQPTPARHILDMIAAGGFSSDDTLVDLGSGLGHVPLLACIVRGVHAIGVELQPDHVASAQETARRFNLRQVRFVVQDARMTDLSVGNVFYMFSPFTGSILRDVVSRLHDESKARQIRVCALGPCTRMLQGQTWLTPNRHPDTESIVIFESQ